MPPELYDRWVAGPALEDRLRAIFAIAGRKLSSDEAAWVWQKLLVLCADRVPGDLFELLVRQYIMLSPEYTRAEQFFGLLMKSRRQPGPAPDMVFMITSCRRYLDKALGLHETLTRRGAHARIMVGDPGAQAASDAGPVTTLPVSDAYEALPQKVLEGLTYLRQTWGPVSVAKIDDDIRIGESFDPSELAAVAERLQYAGQPWGGMCDRCWHLGKTAEQTPIYAKRMKGLFAYGPLYLLGSRAVEHLVRQWVFFPGDLAGRIYEDRAIGELLAEGSIPLQAYPIDRMGGIVDQGERFVAPLF